MSAAQKYHGSRVAFEGSVETISTQLRLLPTSSQILILPNVQSYMNTGGNADFDAYSFVKDVHQAALARNDAATKFLQGSDPVNKRLVFLSGGTAGAVAECITAISEHETRGDVFAAESVFRDIVRNGVKGLVKDESCSGKPRLPRVEKQERYYQFTQDEESENEDPNTRAMREADALYKETETLQPIDCFIRTRPRSLSLSMIGYTDTYDEPSPCFIFKIAPDVEDYAHSSASLGQDDEETCKSLHERDEDGYQAHCTHDQLGVGADSSSMKFSACFEGEPYQPRSPEINPTMRVLSPPPDKFMSPPATPDNVVYGEARLVQMRASRIYKSLTRTRSLDDMELGQRQNSQISLASESSLHMTDTVGTLHGQSRHRSLADGNHDGHPLQLPQAIYGKAKPTTIRRSPPTLSSKSFTQDLRPSYVDRGTDAAQFDVSTSGLDVLDEPFQPVLPFLEDLAIHFTDGSYDKVLESVIQSFKQAAYPVTPFLPMSSDSDDDIDSTPSTPRMEDVFSLEDIDPAPFPPVVEVSVTEEANEYDPFAPQGNDARFTSLHLPRPSQLLAPPQRPQPPTPAATPPPPMIAESDSRFHNFSTLGRSTAVGIQNALRAVLEMYFPAQENGYHQFNYPLLSDMGSLWRPIFGEPESNGDKPELRTTDLILAIGCQRGVKRNFLVALTGQLEKLGAKSSGVTRSGRLDLRYLIANAMQSFTAHPLTDPSQNTLFGNPALLATLIVPHLETYLAAHSNIRFLILEYPAEHLATVVALQSLIGMDLLKVAGIMDTEGRGSEPSSPSGSTHNADAADPISGFPLIPRGQQPSKPNRLSFSKANYPLTCSATDSEIATFISTIWKTLIDISPYYIPQHNPPSALNNRPGTAKSTKSTIANNADLMPPFPPLPPLVSRYTAHHSTYTHTTFVHSAPNSPPLSPPYDADNSTSPLPSPEGVSTPPRNANYFPFPPPPRPASPARSTRSTRSGGARSQTRSGTAALAARSISKDDAQSAYAVSVVEDGEFYDDEERRLMPMFEREAGVRKGNSRKALKWLGLA